MATAAVPTKCDQCGTMCTGKFCSECGADLTEHSPTMRAIRTFTGPVWDFAALFKDVAMTQSLVNRVKSGRINLQSVFTFSLTSAAICGLVKYFVPKSTYPTDGPPFVGDAALCLAIIAMSAAYEWGVHFFLRKKNPNVPLRQSIILMSCFFCVLVPLSFLFGTDKDTDDVSPLETIAGVVMFFFIWRGQKLLYDVRYRDIAWATAKTWLAVAIPTIAISMIALSLK